MFSCLKFFIQRMAQEILGYRNYLFLFSIYQVYKFKLFTLDKELAYFIKLIEDKKDSVIIDAGANIGYTTAIFSKYLPQATILAFEPVKIHVDIIQEIVVFFKLARVKINQLALGNSEKMATMVTPVLNGVIKQGFSYIKGEVKAETATAQLEEPVQMSTLDLQIADTGSNKVVAIKIDVENYEVFVLEGAEKLIAKHRPIIFAELWDNERKQACIKLMKNYGYQVKILINNKLENYCGEEVLNYFFIPTELSL